MKRQLLKKVFPFIIMMMFSGTVANAQFVYTDLIPDKILNCNSNSGCSNSDEYSLDLNEDDINDFILSPQTPQAGCGACGSLIYLTREGYSATVSSTSQSWFADTVGGYAINTLIDSSLSWTNGSYTMAIALPDCVPCTAPGRGKHFVDASASGSWSNIQGRYLALKTQVGNDIYYGWIKLGVGIASNYVTIRIMEYAYNSIPNQPILSGQTMTTGIVDHYFASSINLFPNPADDHLTIDLGSISKKVQVTIADITGKVIYTTIATDTQKVEVNTSDFAKGMYVVQIQSADSIGTKKFVVEK